MLAIEVKVKMKVCEELYPDMRIHPLEKQKKAHGSAPR